jgi:hypothetical protein
MQAAGTDEVIGEPSSLPQIGAINIEGDAKMMTFRYK